jgi:hypothetical protein
MRKKTYRKDLENNWELTDTCFNKDGNATSDLKFVLDANNKIIFYRDYDLAFTRNAEGKIVTPSGNKISEDDKILRMMEKSFSEQIKEIEKELMPSIPDTPAPCQKQQSCIPKVQIFGGYSYLNADFGSKRESFPLGAQVSLVINLSPHIGLGPDISFHTKKIDDQTITRMFFLAKGQYNFGSNDPNDSLYIPGFPSADCPRKIVPDLHVYIGLSTERSVIKIADERFTSSGSGFTFGAGIGVHFNLSKTISLGVQADYLGTKFKESDEINSDVRASAGAIINLGNVYRRFTDVPEMKFGR